MILPGARPGSTSGETDRAGVGNDSLPLTVGAGVLCFALSRRRTSSSSSSSVSLSSAFRAGAFCLLGLVVADACMSLAFDTEGP